VHERCSPGQARRCGSFGLAVAWVGRRSGSNRTTSTLKTEQDKLGRCFPIMEPKPAPSARCSYGPLRIAAHCWCAPSRWRPWKLGPVRQLVCRGGPDGKGGPQIQPPAAGPARAWAGRWPCRAGGPGHKTGATGWWLALGSNWRRSPWDRVPFEAPGTLWPLEHSGVCLLVGIPP